jgi:TP901 family phage tail tape measure protein
MPDEKVKYAIELIDDVSAKLKKINRGLADNDKRFSKTGQSSKGFGNQLSNLAPSLIKGASLVGAVTLALGATKKAFEFTTKAIFSFSGASAKLRAIVQPTTQEFQRLEQAALKLGATTAFTASQVLDAYTEQAKLGQEVNEILESGNSVLNLAAMAQLQLSDAATITVQTLNQFDLTAEETNRVVDVMAKSFTSSALDATKFGESMKFVGTIGSETGNSIEDVTAVLGVLADRSIEASMAGTATRRVMQELANANSKASKVIASTGKSAETFIDKLKILKELNLDVTETTELFGVIASTAATVMIKNADSVDTLAESLENANGSAEKMAETMLDSLPGASVKMKSALEGLALTMKDRLSPAFNFVMRQITDMAQKMTKLLEKEKEAKDLNLEELYERRAQHLNEINKLEELGMPILNFKVDKEKKRLQTVNDLIDAQKRLISAEGTISSAGQAGPVAAITGQVEGKKPTQAGGAVEKLLDADKIVAERQKLADQLLAIQQETEMKSMSGKERELAALEEWYIAQQEKFTGHREFLEAVDLEYKERQAIINADFMEQEAEKEQELVDKKKIWMDELAEKNKITLEQRAQDEKKFRLTMKTTSIDSMKTIANAAFTIGKERTKRDAKLKIEQVKNSKKSEEEKAKAIEAIERDAFEKNKRRSILQAIINGALGATKTIATSGFPAAIPLLIAQAVVTAANIAVIASQKFANGGIVQKEPGKAPFGDQHLIRANPGERVLTQEQQKGLGQTIVIGDTNLVIQGNVTQDTLEEIDGVIQDRNEELRQSLLELTESGRIAGVVF